jgi:signal transduction histidine kinase
MASPTLGRLARPNVLLSDGHYPRFMGLFTALARRRFLVSPLPFRSWAYLLTALIPGALGLTAALTLLFVGGALTKVLIGIPIVAVLGLAGIPMARLERWRLQLIDPEPVESPHGRLSRPGLMPWLATRWGEAATWREFGYAVLLVTLLWPIDLAVAVLAVGVPLALITSPIPVITGGQRGLLPGVAISSPLEAAGAVPLGLALLVGAAYLVTALALVQGRLARTLLSSRGPELRARLTELTLSRARLVDAFEAERRRIERDLHDGAQQRLVAVSMSLGLARLDLPPGPAADNVAHAHEQAKLALIEVRQLIHGIYPQVLTDRGLPAAAEEAADRSTVPVDLQLRLNRRLPQAVEATAYFVISEALANIAKHSRAAHAWIRADLTSRGLLLEIGDDGVGGADAEHGSGLAGLVDRVAVVGGSMSVSSPNGGPTVLTAELPCP